MNTRAHARSTHAHANISLQTGSEQATNEITTDWQRTGDAVSRVLRSESQNKKALKKVST